jgi:hypothetical protein
MTAAVTATRLSGYRSADSALLTGHRLPGELLAHPLAGRPALAEPHTVAPADGRSDERLYIVRDAAFLRFAEIDWVHRRARLEIGVRSGAADQDARLVALAVVQGFEVLNLHRLYGWVTPVTGQGTEALSGSGFAREAVVPQAIWLDSEPRDRELWGVVRDV